MVQSTVIMHRCVNKISDMMALIFLTEPPAVSVLSLSEAQCDVFLTLSTDGVK